VIDFPQMVSTNHYNAEELFVRDLKCLHKFFLRRYNYRAALDDNGVADPVFAEISGGGVGHGGRRSVEKSMDVSLRASGFSSTATKELEKYNEVLRQEAEAAEAAGVSLMEEGGEEGSDDDEDEEEEKEEGEGKEGGGNGRKGFVRLARGEEEVEEVVGSDDEGEQGEEDPEAEAAAAAAVARLYGGGGDAAAAAGGSSLSYGGVGAARGDALGNGQRGTLYRQAGTAAGEAAAAAAETAAAAAAAAGDGDGHPSRSPAEGKEKEEGSDDEDDEDDEFDADPRNRKPNNRGPPPSVASTQRRRLVRPAGAGSIASSGMSRADLGNDPELVRAKLKAAAAKKKSAPGKAAHISLTPLPPNR
jgi:hypothetical protein